MILSDTAIRNRTTVLVMVVMIIVLGTLSYMTLPREAAPDVKIPYIMITTVNRGVSPADIENTITNEIEEKLSGLKGMKEFRSTSMEGMSLVMVEFHSDMDIDVALQRVKDKVDLARPELPQDADEPVEPVVSEINVSERPVMYISMYGDISPSTLKLIAEDMEDELEAVPGVLEVDVLGAVEREIIVETDLDRIVAHGIPVTEFFRAITGENINQSAGGLETDGIKFNVRVPAEFRNPQEFFNLPLGMRNGKMIYLSDVAVVTDSFKDPSSMSRLDGGRSVTLAIRKRIGENIIDISHYVKAILAEARQLVPDGVQFELTLDESEQIEMMIADLENNIATALILVVVVMMIFMGLRSSIIVALVIPLSMLMSFAVIQIMGLTLNMVVLFSLILSLGMLVDNAIVIVENIFRHREMGYNLLEAAMKGASEVAWPVIASTATTVAAFLPMVFWPGIMGDFMKYLPITVIIVLISSLFVAMVISPVICSLFAGSVKVVSRDDDSPATGWFIRSYRKLLDKILHKPVTTLFVSICILVSIVVLYNRRGRGVELFPQIDPAQVVVDIRAPQGTNIRKVDRLLKEVERRVEQCRKLDGNDQYDNLIATSGRSGIAGFMGPSTGPHYANLTILFPDYEERKRPSLKVMGDIRKVVKGIPGAEFKVQEQQEGPPTGEDVTIHIIGKDTAVLRELSQRAMKMIQDVPNLVNVRCDLEAEKPELVFIPDRKKTASLNLTTFIVGSFLKAGIFGSKISDYREYNEQYDIRIRLPLEGRNSVESMMRMQITTPTGKSVPITSLGRFEYRPGLGTIHRINRKRAVTLTGDAEGRLETEVLADVQEMLASMDMPAGYQIRYAGKEEEQQGAMSFLSKAFVIAILLIICILVAQFNTLLAPVIIMTTVILSLTGVYTGLMLFDMPFGVVMTGVGVISLAGVVVNNAIVLLDYTRQLQRRGKALLEATVEAGVTRLRPVLLTAVTTILGLLPMASGISFDFHTMEIATRSESTQWWKSMAIAVIFGLGLATILTLFVVPSLYVMCYRISSRFGSGGLPDKQVEND